MATMRRVGLGLLPLVFVLSLAGGAAASGCGGGQAAVRQAPPPSALGQGHTRFYFFDVGQADCLLVVHDGHTMLVDAGASRYRRGRGYPDIARRVRQITGKGHLDYVVVTHYHADHVGTCPARDSGAGGQRKSGLFDLLDRVTAGTLVDRGERIFGKQEKTHATYEAWVSRWIERGRVHGRRTARVGDTIDMGPGLRVEVVAANGSGRLDEELARDEGAFHRHPPSENDLSVALKFTSGDFELFAGGDLSGVTTRSQGRASYHDIESRTARLVGDVEVYKVNHHGSAHSSNPCFVKVLHPEVSVFSTGENRYGHPSPQVFDSLRALGTVIVTGGADPSVLEAHPRIEQAIAGTDVEVVVAPGGDRYYVNGVEMRSLTEAQERARPDHVSECGDDWRGGPSGEDETDQ